MTFLVDICLLLCVMWAVAGPLISPWIEERLELFLLGVGAMAVTISWSWSEAVIVEAILRPMKVCGAVLLGSLIFSFSHDTMRRSIRRAIERIGPRLAIGLTVVLLGFAASVLTTVIAMLALVEVLYAMRLEDDSQTHVAVLGAFSIGLGGGLTPIGGPIPAITMAKLSTAAYPVSPYFLFELLGPWVVPAILTLGVVAGLSYSKLKKTPEKPLPEDPLSLWSMLLLTGKMYVFIAGLVLLGAGLLPFINENILGAPPSVLYWINSVSAVIDGATLAAMEVSPNMSQNQLRYCLMGVLIAGGALVTGNAPNLIAAHKLKIPLKVWAKAGVPTAVFLMVFYYLSLLAHT
jgi:predicted cation transporter